MEKNETILKKLFTQLVKFGIVGVIAFLIDYGVLILLTEAAGIHYLVSAMISFVVSVIFNYTASMRFVFKGRQDLSKAKEFMIFIVLSVIGLGINELFMWILVDRMHIFYMLSKIFVTAIVMIWNFVTRKIFLEEKTRINSNEL
ncbi:MAG: GtrA family protein [Lachnospiraceae bacterium]|nr:GtrA family protein [Lachnospiraceae bacterium]